MPSINTNEEWRDIPGFGGFYQASDLGRVRVKDRVVTRLHPRSLRMCRFVYKGRVLSMMRTKAGYRWLNLTFDDIHSCVLVHHLVLFAFVGPRPPGMEACHGNGDNTDNRIANLRWDTRTANVEDRQRHGKYARGDSHPMAKLTSDQVRSVRARKLTAKQIAAELGTSVGNAKQIVRGTTWKSA